MKYNFRMNNIMLSLTFVTIVTMPPSLIGGLMGMNVVVPGQEYTDTLVPFYFVLSLIVLFMILFAALYICLVRREGL